MRSVAKNNRFFPTTLNVFDEFFNRPFPVTTKHTWKPAVNVQETDTAFHLELVAPGREKTDFNIEIKDGHLIIGSEQKQTNETKEGDQYTRREFFFSTFKRSFLLPEHVNVDAIKAEYTNGILKVVLPKVEVEVEQPLTIEIA
ncbi:MAG: Hsp20/alpha crystallin family protein [Bacteroidota bacterium]